MAGNAVRVNRNPETPRGRTTSRRWSVAPLTSTEEPQMRVVRTATLIVDALGVSASRAALGSDGAG